MKKLALLIAKAMIPIIWDILKPIIEKYIKELGDKLLLQQKDSIIHYLIKKDHEK